ncbi:MAG: hypothetical protein DHS80DRAFT_25039 [Piptocephalis tieghemiana]|nr:MAG: hypothetical protein DHS80DRAFT_25039 [Piptocephalis tieghemiana]
MVLSTLHTPPLGLSIALYILSGFLALIGIVLSVLLVSLGQDRCPDLTSRSKPLILLGVILWVALSLTHLLASSIGAPCVLDTWVSNILLPGWILLLCAHLFRLLLLCRSHQLRQETTVLSVGSVSGLSPTSMVNSTSTIGSSSLAPAPMQPSYSSGWGKKHQRDERVLALLQGPGLTGHGNGNGDRLVSYWPWLHTPRLPILLIGALGLHVGMTLLILYLGVKGWDDPSSPSPGEEGGGGICSLRWPNAPGHVLSILYLAILMSLFLRLFHIQNHGLGRRSKLPQGTYRIRRELVCAGIMAFLGLIISILLTYFLTPDRTRSVSTFPLALVPGILWALSGLAMFIPCLVQLCRSLRASEPHPSRSVPESEKERGGEGGAGPEMDGPLGPSFLPIPVGTSRSAGATQISSKSRTPIPLTSRSPSSPLPGTQSKPDAYSHWKETDLSRVLLRRPRIRRAFKEFAVRDHSIPLVMFWERSELLLDAAQSPTGMHVEEYAARCEDLIIMFFKPQATWYLPLPHPMMAQVIQAHTNGTLGAHSFLKPQRHALQLLLSGPWSRFMAERKARGLPTEGRALGQERSEGGDTTDEEDDEDEEEGGGGDGGVYSYGGGHSYTCKGVNREEEMRLRMQAPPSVSSSTSWG